MLVSLGPDSRNALLKFKAIRPLTASDRQIYARKMSRPILGRDYLN
jgi:hypothetical protein